MTMTPQEVYDVWEARIFHGEDEGFNKMLGQLVTGQLKLECTKEGMTIRPVPGPDYDFDEIARITGQERRRYADPAMQAYMDGKLLEYADLDMDNLPTLGSEGES